MKIQLNLKPDRALDVRNAFDARYTHVMHKHNNQV